MIDYLNILTSLLILTIGVLLIKLYNHLNRPPNESKGFTFKLSSAGLGAIIIGAFLIFKELAKIF